MYSSRSRPRPLRCLDRNGTCSRSLLAVRQGSPRCVPQTKCRRLALARRTSFRTRWVDSSGKCAPRHSTQFGSTFWSGSRCWCWHRLRQRGKSPARARQCSTTRDRRARRHRCGPRSTR
jgi:hypothetical protein